VKYSHIYLKLIVFFPLGLFLIGMGTGRDWSGQGQFPPFWHPNLHPMGSKNPTHGSATVHCSCRVANLARRVKLTLKFLYATLLFFNILITEIKYWQEKKKNFVDEYKIQFKEETRIEMEWNFLKQWFTYSSIGAKDVKENCRFGKGCPKKRFNAI